MEKYIEEVHMKVKDIKTGFGNPRKISKAKREELQTSMETFGDFGSFVIDEEDNIICGNQRLSVLQEKDPETEVLCKRLIGYTKTELKAINIKDNTHAGEWDMDILADWTSDLVIDLGLDQETEKKKKNEHDKEVPEWVFDCHTLKGKRMGKTDWDMTTTEQDALTPKKLAYFDEASWLYTYEDDFITGRESKEHMIPIWEYSKSHEVNPVKLIPYEE